MKFPLNPSNDDKIVANGKVYKYIDSQNVWVIVGHTLEGDQNNLNIDLGSIEYNEGEGI
jgi:hypothetical protein